MKLLTISLVERDFTGNFQTNHTRVAGPMNVFYCRRRDEGKDAALKAVVEISHDGVNWVLKAPGRILLIRWACILYA